MHAGSLGRIVSAVRVAPKPQNGRIDEINNK